MKSLLVLAWLMAMFCSCTPRYNYYTISGRNVPKIETSQLVSENDTLRIEYQFSDHGGKIGLKIINKTEETIEIDWRKSAIIVGGQAFSYFDPTGFINGRVERDTTAENRHLWLAQNPAYVADFRASVLINEPAQYIFPKSFLQKISPGSIKESISARELRKDEGEIVKLPQRGIVTVSYRKVRFPPEKTPLTFRNFLTFRIGTGLHQKEFSQEHVFYISEHWQSASSAIDFPEETKQRPDWLSLQP